MASRKRSSEPRRGNARDAQPKRSERHNRGEGRFERRLDGHLIVSDYATSERMKGVRTRDTKPELRVRELARALGLHYRVRNRDLPGSPDLANRKRGWAIFVHGCYWHRHPGCKKASTPSRNRAFWQAKFDANVARDARDMKELRAAGFRTLVIWECETKGPDEPVLAKLRVLL